MTPEELLVEAQLTILRLQEWLAALNFREDVYLKNGVPYESQADVLASVAVADRKQYLTFNIAGTEYWMLPDLVTLVPKVGTLALEDGSVTLAKMAPVNSGTVFYRKTAGAGPPEVQTLATLKTDLGLDGLNTGDQDLSVYVLKEAGKNLFPDSLLPFIHEPHSDDQDLSNYVEKEAGSRLITADEIAKLASLKVMPYRISLPASSDVATRVAGAVEGIDYPTGWVLAASAGYNISITHGLGRKVAFVKVFEIDGGVERLAKDFFDAYSGLTGTDNAVIIEGLSTLAVPLRIELFLA